MEYLPVETYEDIERYIQANIKFRELLEKYKIRYEAMCNQDQTAFEIRLQTMAYRTIMYECKKIPLDIEQYLPKGEFQKETITSYKSAKR